jgi:hypothetical protein
MSGPAITAPTYDCLPGCQDPRHTEHGNYDGDCYRIVHIGRVRVSNAARPGELIEVQVQHTKHSGAQQRSVVTVADEPVLSGLSVLTVAEAEELMYLLGSAVEEAEHGARRIASDAAQVPVGRTPS